MPKLKRRTPAKAERATGRSRNNTSRSEAASASSPKDVSETESASAGGAGGAPAGETPARAATDTQVPGFSAGILDAPEPPARAQAEDSSGTAGDATETARPSRRRRGQRGGAARSRGSKRRTKSETQTPESESVDASTSGAAVPEGDTPRAGSVAEEPKAARTESVADDTEGNATKPKRKRRSRTSRASSRETSPRDVGRSAEGEAVEGEAGPSRAIVEEAESSDAAVAEKPAPARRGRVRRAVKSESSRTVSSSGPGVRKMLINAADSDECRIAVLQDGRLDELDIERAASTSNVGNIYKGRVTNVESSIQAAFVDFGLPSHGFLHISDLHPQYFPNSKGEPEHVGRKTPRRQRPPIQHCLRAGGEVIVQIIKEGIGTKGPTLTTYLSIPGRFLVMMPGMDQLGVSRKIEDEDQRRKARDVLGQLSLPHDMGFIVRTAGVDRTKRDLQRDLNYLGRLWKKVVVRIKNEHAPAELYKESDLVIRTIRDVYDTGLRDILVDDAAVAARVREFLAVASPRARDIVSVYEGAEPMFHKYGIESEIDKLHSRRVPLECGGSLIIEQTEALVAVDVNSGKFRVPDNAEETAFRVDLEAVDEIARQLRLRDLGGLILCDMIDLMQDRHRREVENRLRDALKRHKERAKILRMSKFGIIEMTRQRQRPSLATSVFRECPRCAGAGRIKATESVALDVMRQIRLAAQRDGVARVDVELSLEVANDILNRKRQALAEMEKVGSLHIRVVGRDNVHVDHVVLSCTDRRGREVAPLAAEPKRTDTRGTTRPRRTGGRPRRSSRRTSSSG